MKKWIWATVVAIFVLFVGGWFYFDHTMGANAYKSDLSAGKTELQEKKYTAAKDKFQAAVDKKPGAKEANTLLNQTKRFIEGNNDVNEKNFTGAREAYRNVRDQTGGSEVLVTRSKDQIKTMDAVIKNQKTLRSMYKDAVRQHNDKKYEASNETLAQIMNVNVIGQSYYSDIRKDVKTLKKANDRALKSMSNPEKTASANDPQSKYNGVPNNTPSAPSTTNQPATGVAQNTAVGNNSSNNNGNTNSGASHQSDNLNVYQNPGQYQNRFSNSSNTNNNTSNNGNNTDGSDEYNVYKNPDEYSNRF
ncbi:hypothetical protein B808_341 [Fructilactobacillus florum 8D]|uniref:Uncharacterized protein n=2 Tax=Fructilactobacillus florum TaxID=640331 RepID=W9EM58_9LACO|nr:hypothetical protein [Fructilactobacillus florum]EKK20453.1 hypothetical protein B807_804 [Fructilactobacillus florum 2F]ETO40764.1 hypothetical protein B808_341 [Fructilactobacillus florum 8D]